MVTTVVMAYLVVLDVTQTAPAVFLSWLLAQITPLSCILFALLLVVAYRWGFAEAALRALSAHCGP